MYTVTDCHPKDFLSADALFDRVFGPGRYAKTAQRLRENRLPLYEYSRLARANDADTLVGALLTWPLDGDTLFLGPMAVLPQARGHDLGRRLLRAALADVQKPVVLIGAADYYAPFGFVPCRMAMPGPVDPARLLRRESVACGVVE